MTLSKIFLNKKYRLYTLAYIISVILSYIGQLLYNVYLGTVGIFFSTLILLIIYLKFQPEVKKWILLALILFLFGDTCSFLSEFYNNEWVLWLAMTLTTMWNLLFLKYVYDRCKVKYNSLSITVLVLLIVTAGLIFNLITSADFGNYYVLSLLNTVIIVIACFLTFSSFIKTNNSKTFILFILYIGLMIANALFGIYKFQAQIYLIKLVHYILYDAIQFTFIILLAKEKLVENFK